MKQAAKAWRDVKEDSGRAGLKQGLQQGVWAQVTNCRQRESLNTRLLTEQEVQAGLCVHVCVGVLPIVADSEYSVRIRD